MVGAAVPVMIDRKINRHVSGTWECAPLQIHEFVQQQYAQTVPATPAPIAKATNRTIKHFLDIMLSFK